MAPRHQLRFIRHQPALILFWSREHVDRAMQTQAASSAEDGGSQSGEVWAAYATEVFVNTDSAYAARLAAGSVIELSAAQRTAPEPSSG